jgi:hypothetical protein
MRQAQTFENASHAATLRNILVTLGTALLLMSAVAFTH